MSDCLRPHGLQSARFLCPWDSPEKNTGVGCCFLLQEVFLAQGPNSCLLHLLYCQVGSLPLVPPGKSMAVIILKQLIEINKDLNFRIWTWHRLYQTTLICGTLMDICVQVGRNVSDRRYLYSYLKAEDKCRLQNYSSSQFPNHLRFTTSFTWVPNRCPCFFSCLYQSILIMLKQEVVSLFCLKSHNDAPFHSDSKAYKAICVSLLFSH